MRIVLATLLLFCITQNACADLILTARELGGNVVIEGAGDINVAGLASSGVSTQAAGLDPSIPLVMVGSNGDTDFYTGVTGPANIGSGGGIAPSSTSGAIFGIGGPGGNTLFLPRFYAGANISGSATYAGTTFVGLGLDLGIHEWTLPTPGGTERISLHVVVPEPSSIALLSATLGVCAFARRRRVG